MIALPELRHALQIHRRSFWQSFMVVIFVAVAVSAVTIFFNLHGYLNLQSSPGIEKPDQLISVGITDGVRFNVDGGVPRPLLNDLSDQASTLSNVAGFRLSDHDVIIDDELYRASFAAITEGYFDGLGISLYSGKPIGSREVDLGSPVVVISYEFWESIRASAESEYQGHRVLIGGQDYQIIGVTPPGFQGFSSRKTPSVYISLGNFVADILQAPLVLSDQMSLKAVARITESSSLDSVRQEVRALNRFLKESHPDRFRGTYLDATRPASDDPDLVQTTQSASKFYLFSASILLIISAVNLGLYSISRAAGRRQEFHIRYSVGAPRYRLVSQVVLEAIIIVSLGVFFGLIFSVFFKYTLPHHPDFSHLPWEEVEIFNIGTLLFLLFVATVITGVSSLFPVKKLISNRIAGSEGDPTLNTSRWLTAAVSVQLSVGGTIFALALSLSIGLSMIHDNEVGFEPKNLHVISLGPTQQQYSPNRDAVEPFRDHVRESLTQSEHIESIAFGRDIPYKSSPTSDNVKIVNGQIDEIRARQVEADQFWIKTFQLSTLRGQVDKFLDDDEVVVTRTFTEKAWGDIDVVGQKISVPQGGYRISGEVIRNDKKIVAVVDDFSFQHPAEEMQPTILYKRSYPTAIHAPVIARTNLKVRDLKTLLASELDVADIELEVTGEEKLASSVVESMSNDRARVLLTVWISGLVLAMVLFGFRNTLAYLLERKRFELAIRSAVGASEKRLLLHILGYAVKMAMPGLLVGYILGVIAVYFALERFEILGLNPWISASIALLSLLSVLLVSVFRQANHDAAINPANSFRQD